MTNFNIDNPDDIQEQIRAALSKIVSQIEEDSDTYILNYRKGYLHYVHSTSLLLDILEKGMAAGKEIPNKFIYMVLSLAMNLAEDICIDEEIERMEYENKENDLQRIAEKVAEYLSNEI